LSEQSYRIAIDPGSHCQLNGIYASAVNRFQVVCIAGVTDCPTPVDTIFFSFSVQSENFCAQIASNVAVSTTMSSFSDSTITSPSDDFLISTNNPQRAYFKVAASSNSVSVQSVSVTGVSLSSSILGSKILWASGITADGTTFGIQVNQDKFSVLVTDAFDVPQDETSIVTITANMQVYYVGGLKRAIEQVQQIPSTTQSSFIINNDGINMGNSASGFGVSVVVGFVAVWLVFL